MVYDYPFTSKERREIECSDTESAHQWYDHPFTVKEKANLEDRYEWECHDTINDIMSGLQAMVEFSKKNRSETDSYECLIHNTTHQLEVKWYHNKYGCSEMVYFIDGNHTGYTLY